MQRYKTSENDQHLRDEELQWAAMLGKGSETAGMALVHIQKLCTAYHEIGPAIEADVVIETPESLAFLKARLIARLDTVLRALNENDLGDIAGVTELLDLRTQTQAADTLMGLAGLAEPVHRVNHTLVDALEALQQ